MVESTNSHWAVVIGCNGYQELWEEEYQDALYAPLYDVRRVANYFKDLRYNVQVHENLESNDHLEEIFKELPNAATSKA